GGVVAGHHVALAVRVGGRGLVDPGPRRLDDPGVIPCRARRVVARELAEHVVAELPQGGDQAGRVLEVLGHGGRILHPVPAQHSEVEQLLDVVFQIGPGEGAGRHGWTPAVLSGYGCRLPPGGEPSCHVPCGGETLPLYIARCVTRFFRARSVCPLPAVTPSLP